MSKIIITGNKCQIQDETDLDFLQSLNKHLSVFIESSIYSQAYKKGFYDKNDGNFKRWDGFNHLLSANLIFKVGLLDRVVKFFKDSGKDVDVVDGRTALTKNYPIDISMALEKLKLEPYPYQQEIVDKLVNERLGIVKSATGSGKSLIMAMTVARLGKTTCIFVIGKTLLYQFHELFSNLFSKDSGYAEEIGIIGDGKCIITKINIVSVWSVGQALSIKKKDLLNDDEDSDEEAISKEKYLDIKKLINETKVAMLDESHIASCNTIKAIHKNLNNIEHFFGFSGSPFKGTKNSESILLEELLGNYLADISASFLIKQGYLAKPYIKFVNVPKKNIEGTYQQVYREYVVENEQRNNLVVKYTKDFVEKGRKTLVIFNNISHGKILYDLISGEGIRCTLLSGKDDQEEREQAKQDLINGNIDCIICSKILEIGADIPIASALVLASPSKSIVKTIQRVGRVIRKYPGKENSFIIDFVDNIKYLHNHSKTRLEIYRAEPEFEISWPKNV
jgi:superfamily II DNA or RNA helicase